MAGGISLNHCPTLKELPALDTLQDHEELYVYEYDELNSIPNSFTRRNSFVSLVQFSCVNCRKLDCEFPEMECADSMPKLQALRLDGKIKVSVHSEGSLAQKKLTLKHQSHWQHLTLLSL